MACEVSIVNFMMLLLVKASISASIFDAVSLEGEALH